MQAFKFDTKPLPEAMINTRTQLISKKPSCPMGNMPNEHMTTEIMLLSGNRPNKEGVGE